MLRFQGANTKLSLDDTVSGDIDIVEGAASETNLRGIRHAHLMSLATINENRPRHVTARLSEKNMAVLRSG